MSALVGGRGALLARVRDSVIRRARGYLDVDRLVSQGLRLGTGVYLNPSVVIDPSFPWLVSIGDDSTLAPGVHVIVHDAAAKRHVGYSVLGRVCIGSRVYIGAGAIILPGVTIGDDAIVGAGSVVRRDVAPGVLVIGNPAEPVSTTAAFVEKHRARLKSVPALPEQGWTLSGGITAARGTDGPSSGMTSVVDILNGQSPRFPRTPVFGCPVSDSEGDRQP